MLHPLRARATIGCALVLAALAARPAAYDPAVEDLGTRLADGLEAHRVGAVAVRDFTALDGEATELGRFLAEEVSAALVDALASRDAVRTRVIDRLRLHEVLEERRLEASAIIPAEELREVGRIAGVDALVTGRITAFSDAYRLTVKVLDSRTARDLLHASAEVPRTSSLRQLEKHSLSVVVTPGDCGGLEIDLDDAAPKTYETEHLEVELMGCVRTGETVHCLAYVTSRDHDRSVYLFGESRIVLADGRQVGATRVSVGGSIATGSRGRAGDALVEGVRLEATASFGPVPQEVGAIRQLQLDLQGDDATFRDVPIERP